MPISELHAHDHATIQSLASAIPPPGVSYADIFPSSHPNDHACNSFCGIPPVSSDTPNSPWDIFNGSEVHPSRDLPPVSVPDTCDDLYSEPQLPIMQAHVSAS